MSEPFAPPSIDAQAESDLTDTRDRAEGHVELLTSAGGVAPLSAIAQGKLSDLIDTLHKTEGQVELLTSGQVDSVTDRAGRTLLLRRSQDRLRASNAAKEAAILNLMPARVALLDIHGAIVSMNASWTTLADAHVLQGPDYRVGSNYVQHCEEASGSGADEAHRAARGILDIIENRRSTFSLEYVVEAPDPRFYLLNASPLEGDRLNGVVLMHVDISEQKRRDQSLLRFAGAMEAISDAVFLTDRASMRFIYVNDAACRLQGCSREELLAIDSWVPDHDTREELEAAFDAVIANGGKSEPVEKLVLRGDDRIWLELRRHATRSGSSWAIVTLVRDVTDRRRTAERIAQLSRMRAVLSGVNALALRARDREELFRESCRTAVGAGGFRMTWIAIMGPDGPRMVACDFRGDGKALEDAVRAKLAGSSSFSAYEGRLAAEAVREKKTMVSNDILNDPRVIEREANAVAGVRSMAILPLVVSGDAIGVFAMCAETAEFFHGEELALLNELVSTISFAIDHFGKQERLTFLAYHDVLTGLANRNLFLERVGRHLRAAAQDHHGVGLFLVNLERFKGINDGLGQAAGDSILKQVADWLSRHAGGPEFVARIGADNFAVVLPVIRPEGDLIRLVEQTLASFQHQPFRNRDSVLRIAMRTGVALFPDDGVDADELFRNAEAALKKTKLTKEPYLFHTAAMTATAAGRLTLENQLRRAVDNEEFVLFYQPKVDLRTGRVIGAEGLIRWNDPATGLVPPGRFIPILEETGLINEVGRWALRRAIRDYLRWLDLGFAAVPLAVNVSPLQLRNRAFVSDVRDAISVDVRLDGAVELEITESVIVEDVKHNVASLSAIREIGIRVAIDDFGTGFSSLSYLSHLPVDTLKIDRSFVTGLTDTTEGQALVSTIISLAHALKLTVVAEGVETLEQRRLLRMLHCDEMQGFLFSEPLPREAFEMKFLSVGTDRPRLKAPDKPRRTPKSHARLARVPVSEPQAHDAEGGHGGGAATEKATMTGDKRRHDAPRSPAFDD